MMNREELKLEMLDKVTGGSIEQETAEALVVLHRRALSDMGHLNRNGRRCHYLRLW